MNIPIALKHPFCKDFLRRNSDLIFLYAYLTTSTLPLVLQHSLCTSWLPMSKKYAAVSWEPRDQNLPYECALKPQESGTWEKQAATYHSNRITHTPALLRFINNKCKKNHWGDNEHMIKSSFKGVEEAQISQQAAGSTRKKINKWIFVIFSNWLRDWEMWLGTVGILRLRSFSWLPGKWKHGQKTKTFWHHHHWWRLL